MHILSKDDWFLVSTCCQSSLVKLHQRGSADTYALHQAKLLKGALSVMGRLGEDALGKMEMQSLRAVYLAVLEASNRASDRLTNHLTETILTVKQFNRILEALGIVLAELETRPEADKCGRPLRFAKEKIYQNTQAALDDSDD